MTTVTERTIDIEKILKGKMGAKAKFVPGFLVSWLKKIAHQDQVNAFLWESRDKVGVEWLEECVKYLDMTLNIVGKENLPDPNDGKLYTFVSNHPLGGEDGVALGAIIGRFYEGRFRYLVNDLLMNLPGLAPLCIPINKTGNQSRNFPAMVEAGFQSDHHMLMFLQTNQEQPKSLSKRDFQKNSSLQKPLKMQWPYMKSLRSPHQRDCLRQRGLLLMP